MQEVQCSNVAVGLPQSENSSKDCNTRGFDGCDGYIERVCMGNNIDQYSHIANSNQILEIKKSSASLICELILPGMLELFARAMLAHPQDMTASTDRFFLCKSDAGCPCAESWVPLSGASDETGTPCWRLARGAATISTT